MEPVDSPIIVEEKKLAYILRWQKSRFPQKRISLDMVTFNTLLPIGTEDPRFIIAPI